MICSDENCHCRIVEHKSDIEGTDLKTVVPEPEAIRGTLVSQERFGRRVWKDRYEWERNEA